MVAPKQQTFGSDGKRCKGRLHGSEQCGGFGRWHLVLYGDMWAPALAVLGGKAVVPKPGKCCAQCGKRCRLQGVGDAAAQRAKADNFDREGGLLSGCPLDAVGNCLLVIAWQMVEQRHMRGDVVKGRRKVPSPQRVETPVVSRMQG